MKIQKSFYTIFLCTALLSLPVFLHAQVNVSDSPSAVVEQPVHEFDPVPEGAVVTHDFIILNRGMTPLLIKKVNTG